MLGLHKPLTHAEKSRVLKDSAEEQAKSQAAHCLQVNRNQGMLGTSEKQALVWRFFEVLPPLPGGTESHVCLSGGGGKYGLRYFKESQCGHFSFTHWKELPKME